MKIFKIELQGLVPHYIQKQIDMYKDKPTTPDFINKLNEDIEFLVCGGDCHGNLNIFDKTAWLSPKNGNNTWSASISW